MTWEFDDDGGGALDMFSWSQQVSVVPSVMKIHEPYHSMMVGCQRSISNFLNHFMGEVENLFFILAIPRML